jgi:hypothetical protein
MLLSSHTNWIAERVGARDQLSHCCKFLQKVPKFSEISLRRSVVVKSQSDSSVLMRSRLGQLTDNGNPQSTIVIISKRRVFMANTTPTDTRV